MAVDNKIKIGIPGSSKKKGNGLFNKLRFPIMMF